LCSSRLRAFGLILHFARGTDSAIGKGNKEAAMTVSKMDDNDRMTKVKQYGTTGVLVAGAFAAIAYLRSGGGRERMNTLLGGQLSGLESQLQTAIQENMPMLDEAIDSLAETIKQGIASLNNEVTHYADEVKMRIRDYASAPALAVSEADHPDAGHDYAG